MSNRPYIARQQCLLEGARFLRSEASDFSKKFINRKSSYRVKRAIRALIYEEVCLGRVFHHQGGLSAVEPNPSPKDHLLPYCAHLDHAADTLFLIAEEDMRVYEGEANPLTWQLTRLTPTAALETLRGETLGVVETASWPEDRTSKHSRDSSFRPLRRFPRGSVGEQIWREHEANTERAAWLPSDKIPHLHVPITTTMRPPVRDLSQLEEQASPELQDVLSICNAASRLRIGNFIWLTWCNEMHPNWQPRPYVPRGGSNLIAIDAAGARWMLEHWDDVPADHIDLTLLRTLRGKWNKVSGFGASYVYPPIGNFVEHNSKCSYNIDRRATLWNKEWCQGGTRKNHPHDVDRVLRTWGPDIVSEVRRTAYTVAVPNPVLLHWTVSVDALLPSQSASASGSVAPPSGANVWTSRTNPQVPREKKIPRKSSRVAEPSPSPRSGVIPVSLSSESDSEVEQAESLTEQVWKQVRGHYEALPTARRRREFRRLVRHVTQRRRVAVGSEQACRRKSER